jgi:hypothetical protein
MKFVKNDREDYTEYDVVNLVESMYGAKPIEKVVGYVTKFSDKKWAFRPAKDFYTNVSPTTTFQSRELATTTALEDLHYTGDTVDEKAENLNQMLKFMTPKRKKANNRKNKKGRHQQLVEEVYRDASGKPILDENGNKIKTGKVKRILH